MTAVACSVYSAKLTPAWTGEGPRGEGAPAGSRQGYQPMCLESADTLHRMAGPHGQGRICDWEAGRTGSHSEWRSTRPRV